MHDTNEFIIQDGVLEIYIGGDTCVTVPEGVRKIADSAFDLCGKLKEIAVAEGNPVYSSRNGALMNKKKTVLIRCPEGVRGEYAIPDGVRGIGREAFVNRGGRGPRSVTLPESVREIGALAFEGCLRLRKITVPAGVRHIGYYAFWQCPRVTIHAPAGSVAEAYAVENMLGLRSVPPTAIDFSPEKW